MAEGNPSLSAILDRGMQIGDDCFESLANAVGQEQRWLRTIKEKIKYKNMAQVEVTLPLIADVKMDVAKTPTRSIGS
jgi:hypothetical protein